MSQKELRVDPERLKAYHQAGGDASSGVFVRAKDKTGRWGSYDFVVLDKESLLSWLRSRGGDNPWAEDVLGILLGHGHLHSGEEG